MRMSDLRSSSRLEAIKDREKLARLRAARVIGVDLPVSDDAVLADDITGVHRQRPTVLVVEAGKRPSEPLVHLLHILGHYPQEAERRTDLATSVAQNGK